MSNKHLNIANRAKQDEFYTRLPDIENELKHYKEHFENKVIYCNCDDPFESNFFKYFKMNFDLLKLKKLIATNYWMRSSSLQLDLLNELRRIPYKATVEKIRNDVTDIRIEKLKGSGDFRSQECIELLEQADIVVTNPPFSLFREYVAQLVKYNKKFVIIGSITAITYKGIFPLLRENKLWLGYHLGSMEFCVPANSERRGTCFRIDENKQNLCSVGNICWFTNLDIKKRYESLVLTERYSSEKYQKYDNYDAINVDKTNDIPCDYDGVIGVPISFMDKYCPEQFEIIGVARSFDKGAAYLRTNYRLRDTPFLRGKELFNRVFVKLCLKVPVTA